MELFMIAGTDFTKLITVPSYSVNREDIYQTWTDANHINHRYRTRTRVSGSFTVFFNTVEEYQLWLKTIEQNKNLAGYIENCKVYCNNTDTVETVNLFIDFNFSDILPVIGTALNQTFSITISER